MVFTCMSSSSSSVYFKLTYSCGSEGSSWFTTQSSCAWVMVKELQGSSKATTAIIQFHADLKNKSPSLLFHHRYRFSHLNESGCFASFSCTKDRQNWKRNLLLTQTYKMKQINSPKIHLCLNLRLYASELLHLQLVIYTISKRYPVVRLEIIVCANILLVEKNKTPKWSKLRCYLSAPQSPISFFPDAASVALFLFSSQRQSHA